MTSRDRTVLRIKGSGRNLHVRLRARSSEPLASVWECCRAAMALDKELPMPNSSSSRGL
jgi:hypothetical protein